MITTLCVSISPHGGLNTHTMRLTAGYSHGLVAYNRSEASAQSAEDYLRADSVCLRRVTL